MVVRGIGVFAFACSLILGCNDDEQSEAEMDAAAFLQAYKISDNEVPGWSQDTTFDSISVWVGDELFEKINGGADLYLLRGCLITMFQNMFGATPSICQITSMDFGTQPKADSMFRYQKETLAASVLFPGYDEGTAIGVSSLSGVTAYFHSASLYFEVMLGGFEESEEAIQTAAQFISVLKGKTNDDALYPQQGRTSVEATNDLVSTHKVCV